MPVLAGGAGHRASLRVPKPSLAPVPGWWGVPDQGFRGVAAESASAARETSPGPAGPGVSGTREAAGMLAGHSREALLSSGPGVSGRAAGLVRVPKASDWQAVPDRAC